MSTFSDEENAVMTDDAQIEQVESADDDLLDEAYEAHSPQGSFWSWLRAWFTGSSAAQLEELTEAIAQDPEVPSHYVLRGELYMQGGEYELAAIDFEQALQLAAARFETDDWGLLSQVLRDQAEYGLERAERRLARKQKRQS